MQRITEMSVRKSTALTLALVPLIVSALTGCATLQTGAAQARIDAATPHIGPCAGALAGEDMPEARARCLPLVVILDGA
jgi:hypothetical protein